MKTYTDDEIARALEWLDDIKGTCSSDNEYIYGQTIQDLIKQRQEEIDHLREATKKVKSDLKYYLDTNEENGVVWIPKFTINNLVKKMTEERK